ncbi:MAG: FkbM family methyltransferase, partial [Tepidisphaeraceae bacterium]
MSGLSDEIFVPHVGWLAVEPGDEVGLFLRQGWFETSEQTLLWLYLREGDVVVDCGAHVGLFTVLAGRAAGTGGRVISIEPSPATAELLRQNVARNGLGNVQVVQSAAGASAGRAVLARQGDDGKSAYNHLGAAGAEGVEVDVVTLDELFERQKVERAAFLKVDVEGFEIDVLVGAARAIEAGKLPLVMVEFNELNLRREGKTTQDLFAAVESRGMRFYGFDVDALRLVPRSYEGPIWYDNLFATADVEAVNRRLGEAGAGRQRIVREIVGRGKAAAKLREAEYLAREVESFKAARAELEARLGEMGARVSEMGEHVKAAAESVRRADERASEFERWAKEADARSSDA